MEVTAMNQCQECLARPGGEGKEVDFALQLTAGTGRAQQRRGSPR